MTFVWQRRWILLFIRIVLLQDERVDTFDYVNVIKMMCALAAAFWPIASGDVGDEGDYPCLRRAFVCRAPPKPAPKKEGHSKVGIHIVFPDVIVTSAGAMAFRSLCISRLEETFGENTFSEGWENVFDKAVYDGSGFRMPWASKGKNENR